MLINLPPLGGGMGWMTVGGFTILFGSFRTQDMGPPLGPPWTSGIGGYSNSRVMIR